MRIIDWSSDVFSSELTWSTTRPGRRRSPRKFPRSSVVPPPSDDGGGIRDWGLGIRQSSEPRPHESRIPHPQSRNKPYAGANRQRIKQSEGTKMRKHSKHAQNKGPDAATELHNE